jgi:DNA-binding NtrC family response regulator
MRRAISVLLVEDKESMRGMLAESMRDKGFVVHEAAEGPQARAMLESASFDVVVSDVRLPGLDGLHLLRAAREKRPHARVILMTAYGSVEKAVEAMRDGAFDFLTKPFDVDHLLELVERAAESGKLQRENILLRERFREQLAAPVIVGESPLLKAAMEKAARAAKLDTTILLRGESGTGKELFARAVHHWSPRADGPFVVVNCAAIPETLLESELFGYEKGAFTGAVTSKAGKYELAQAGTLFLDEIGDLPASLQAKILRALQGGEIERLGATSPLRVNVRVVAATNRDLERAVEEGAFREDLYYRVSVFPIEIPPLRHRREDIAPLSGRFLARLAREMKRPTPVLSDPALEMLVSHAWPGNVRELENVLERSLIMCDSSLLEPEHLDLPQVTGTLKGWSGEPLREVTGKAVWAAEESALLAAMRLAGGTKTKAADMLGVSYKTLLTKLKEHGL